MKNGFFPLIHRMKYVKRWNLMRNINDENLMEHSFETAFLAHTLAIIGNKVYNKSLDCNAVAVAALYHDCSEIITGDMPTPVKYENEELKKSYKAVELKAKERLFDMISFELQEDFGKSIFFEEQNENYKYIKAADKLSAYIKCLEENQGGNKDFLGAEIQLKNSLEQMKMPEVEYFMKNFIGLYGRNLDELTK